MEKFGITGDTIKNSNMNFGWMACRTKRDKHTSSDEAIDNKKSMAFSDSLVTTQSSSNGARQPRLSPGPQRRQKHTNKHNISKRTKIERAPQSTTSVRTISISVIPTTLTKKHAWGDCGPLRQRPRSSNHGATKPLRRHLVAKMNPYEKPSRRYSLSQNLGRKTWFKADKQETQNNPTDEFDYRRP